MDDRVHESIHLTDDDKAQLQSLLDLKEEAEMRNGEAQAGLERANTEANLAFFTLQGIEAQINVAHITLVNQNATPDLLKVIADPATSPKSLYDAEAGVLDLSYLPAPSAPPD